MMGNDKAELRSVWEVKRKIGLPAAPTSAAEAANVERTLRDVDGVL
jgi:hypothetical protein